MIPFVRSSNNKLCRELLLGLLFWRCNVMKRKIMICGLLAAAFFFQGSSIAMFGQAVSGTLVGTVQDSSGAAVAKASVTVTQVGTDTTYQSVTNEAGNYTIPSLPPG